MPPPPQKKMQFFLQEWIIRYTMHCKVFFIKLMQNNSLIYVRQTSRCQWNEIKKIFFFIHSFPTPCTTIRLTCTKTSFYLIKRIDDFELCKFTRHLMWFCYPWIGAVDCQISYSLWGQFDVQFVRSSKYINKTYSLRAFGLVVQHCKK